MKKWFYKRWICLILCFGLIVPQGFRVNSIHVAAAQTGTVTASSLNVRTSPSTTASRLQTNGTNVFLLRGETVTILGQENGWYHISLKFNGRTMTGYVHGDFLQAAKPTVTVTPKPTAVPKPTVAPKPTAKPTPKPTAIPKPVAPTPIPANHDPNKVVKDFEHNAIVTASSLNVRRGPGTTFARITGLSKGQNIVVLNEVMVGSAKWYRISYQNGSGNTGYVLSDFIKLTFAKTVKGRIVENKLKIRSSSGSKGAYLKNVAGNIITLNSNKAVTITDEVMVASEKWFKLSFTFGGKKYVGYALANQVRFEIPTPKATPTLTPKATATPVPTPMETPTPVPTLVPTAVPTKVPTPTLGATPTSGAAPTSPIMLEVPNIQIYTNIKSGTTGYVCNTIQLNIVKSNLAKQDLLYDDNNQPITLNNSDKISVLSAISFDNIVWYQIQRDNIKGYVRAEYIYVGEEPPVMQGPGLQTPTPTQPPWGGPLDDVGFELKLISEGFPESYKEPLRKLRQLNPTWEFKAYHTGLDWNTVIREQSIPGKNLLPNNKSIEWKSLEAGAYNWRTDSFIVYDGSTWVTASKAAIEYYMDPRNFLDDRGIFQFELLSYQNGYQNTTGVENILKGTALFNKSYIYTDDSGKIQTSTYGETFIKAAEYSGVSPYHLASRVKQEVVTGPNTLSNSVSGTVAGYEGLYNFFNIGAHDSTAPGGAIANGLKYAQNGSSNAKNNELYLIPWINQYKSIVGGSYFIGNSYINRGQNTVYLQKFNVTPRSTHFHQYMTNVEAPFAEAKKICVAYSNMKNTPIVFSIPVYINLPTNPVPAPKTQFNPNNWLKSLKVFNLNGQELTITPTFSQTERNYNLIVANSVDFVNIKATTVSNKATLSGTGDIQLNVGNNKLCVTVIAENGDRAEYIINIVREN